jgi:hypothetical protein
MIRSLLCINFEDHIKLYRYSEKKAGDTEYEPDRSFLDAKDISKQIRNSVRDPGLVVEIAGGCNEYSKPNDASYLIERAQVFLRRGEDAQAAMKAASRPASTSSSFPSRPTYFGL